jgi:hypothetical protein
MSLLSGGFGLRTGMMGGFGLSMSRGADLGSFQVGKEFGFFGRGSLGLGGGLTNPALLLTAPLLEGGSGSTTPPSPRVFSSSAVQQAMQSLQSNLRTDVPSGARPTHESVGALEDDLDAIRKGTLSGTAAQTKIQSDQAAVAMAIPSNSASSMSGTSSSTTDSTLQSVAQYLVGLPGVSGIGVRDFSFQGMGWGGPARGGFMGWR